MSQIVLPKVIQTVVKRFEAEVDRRINRQKATEVRTLVYVKSDAYTLRAKSRSSRADLVAAIQEMNAEVAKATLTIITDVQAKLSAINSNASAEALNYSSRASELGKQIKAYDNEIIASLPDLKMMVA